MLNEVDVEKRISAIVGPRTTAQIREQLDNGAYEESARLYFNSGGKEHLEEWGRYIHCLYAAQQYRDALAHANTHGQISLDDPALNLNKHLILAMLLRGFQQTFEGEPNELCLNGHPIATPEQRRLIFRVIPGTVFGYELSYVSMNSQQQGARVIYQVNLQYDTENQAYAYQVVDGAVKNSLVSRLSVGKQIPQTIQTLTGQPAYKTTEMDFNC